MLEWFSDALEWLVDFLLWLPRQLWQLILDGLASFIEWIPAPDFMEDLAGWMGDLDPAIAYFIEPMQVGPGVTMILGAMVIRFVIRRIPVVG